MNENTNTKSKYIELILPVLISILSILTGFAAYKSAAIGSDSTDNYFIAQTHLTDANLLYIEQGQEILFDRLLYEKMGKNIVSSEEVSKEALESLKREEGPFDKAYYESMYKAPKALIVEQDKAFEIAKYDSDRSVSWQLVVLIMAIGTAFAAWGSIAENESMSKMLFTIFSTLALIAGLIQIIMIPGSMA